MKLVNGNIPRRRVLATEKEAYERKVSLAQSKFDTLLNENITSSHIVEKFMTESPEDNIDIIMSFNNANADLFKYFVQLTRSKGYIVDSLVQSFNKEVFQQGLLEATNATADPSSRVQIYFATETAATNNLNKWFSIFKHLRASEELRQQLVRAGLLELLSGILAVARAPATVCEEDNINKIKSLSSALCRSETRRSMFTHLDWS